MPNRITGFLAAAILVLLTVPAFCVSLSEVNKEVSLLWKLSELNLDRLVRVGLNDDDYDIRETAQRTLLDEFRDWLDTFYLRDRRAAVDAIAAALEAANEPYISLEVEFRIRRIVGTLRTEIDEQFEAVDELRQWLRAEEHPFNDFVKEGESLFDALDDTEDPDRALEDLERRIKEFERELDALDDFYQALRYN